MEKFIFCAVSGLMRSMDKSLYRGRMKCKTYSFIPGKFLHTKIFTSLQTQNVLHYPNLKSKYR